MLRRTLVPALVLCLAAAAPARAVDLGLVATLVSKLGVSEKQAEGGAGTILDYAKNNLSRDDFSKVATALPETESLLKAVPKSDTSSLGAIGGALGGGSSTLGTVAGLASLTGSFQKLGLSSDMVGKFIPIVLDYAQGKGGNAVSGILAKVLTPSSAPAATPAAPVAAAPAATAAPKAPEPTATATAKQPAPTATKKPASKSSTKKATPAPTKPKS